MKSITLIDGFFIGLAQAIALIPGVSRSGITISAGLFRGLDRVTSARFTFLLSIPIVFGAGSKKLMEILVGVFRGTVSSLELSYFAVGIVFSFIFGYLAVRFLISYLAKRSLWVFVWYRVGLAAAVILLTTLF